LTAGIEAILRQLARVRGR